MRHFQGALKISDESKGRRGDGVGGLVVLLIKRVREQMWYAVVVELEKQRMRIEYIRAMERHED